MGTKDDSEGVENPYIPTMALPRRKQLWPIILTILGAVVVIYVTRYDWGSPARRTVSGKVVVNVDEQDVAHAMITAPTGAKLEISIPTCFRPTFTLDLATAHGQWNFENSTAGVFSCSRNGDGMWVIAGRGKYSRCEANFSKGDGITKPRLVESRDGYEIYRDSMGGRDYQEITSFVDPKGYHVCVEYLLLNPQVHTVDRRLNDDFEVTYTIRNQSPDRAAMKLADDRVMAYLTSITGSYRK